MKRHGIALIVTGVLTCILPSAGNSQTVQESDSINPPGDAAEPKELPVQRIPHPGSAAEAYFSPDGTSLICNARLEGDGTYYVYTMKLDGTNVRRINDRGKDACSYFFPDGQRIIWTSTRDCLDMPEGDYSEPSDYPQGAEIYASALDGSNVERLTKNHVYDAEVSVSPDGKWVLFTRQIDGNLDLWRMKPDGTDAVRLTNTPEWQEGGAFYMPDSNTIIFRAWRSEDGDQSPKPMAVFTISNDGSERRRITHEPGTNWAPYPAPDGEHFVFVKMLPPHNFELFLMSLDTGAQRRLTYSDAFDGYPVISPDGRTLLFSSSRDVAPGERALHLFRMDISSLRLGPAVPAAH